MVLLPGLAHFSSSALIHVHMITPRSLPRPASDFAILDSMDSHTVSVKDKKVAEWGVRGEGGGGPNPFLNLHLS